MELFVTIATSQTPLFAPLPIQVGRMEPGDLEETKRLHDSIFPIKYNDTFFRRLLSDRQYTCLVAKTEDRVVGVISARVRLDSSLILAEKPYGYIMTFGVDSEQRGKGIGSLLLRNLIKVLTTDMQCDKIGLRLHVLPDNRGAIRLYTRFGFNSIRTVKDYYLIDGAKLDALEMALPGTEEARSSCWGWVLQLFGIGKG